jgi:1-acyl-sn-glycerol-3-phosphate acyltransferase
MVEPTFRTLEIVTRLGVLATALAVRRRRRRLGELVGVYPEATISRSFELKEFETGAVRMASEADVPIVPMIVWGTQRIWTKDHPRQLGRNKVPVTVQVGAPLHATVDISSTDAALRESMTALLHQAQRRYPHPAGAYLGAAPAWRRGADLDRGGPDGRRRGCGAGRERPGKGLEKA